MRVRAAVAVSVCMGINIVEWTMTRTLWAALQAAASAPAADTPMPGWLDPLFVSFILAIAGTLYVILRLLHSPADKSGSKES